MGKCPEPLPMSGVHVCCHDFEMPPQQDIVSCSTDGAPEPVTPVVGIESGAVTLCMLVDGTIQTFIVEVVRPDDDAPATATAQIIYHNIGDGTTTDVAPGPTVACTPCVSAACLEVDGTAVYGQVVEAVGADGPILLSALVDGVAVDGVIVDSGLCC